MRRGKAAGGAERWVACAVRLDAGFHARTGAHEAVEALQLVAGELVVGRIGEGEKLVEKGADWGGPRASVSAAARGGAKRTPIPQIGAPELI